MTVQTKDHEKLTDFAALEAAGTSGLVSRRDDVSLARLSPFMDDASLAKLTVSDTNGESRSEDVSDAVVLGSESA